MNVDASYVTKDEMKSEIGKVHSKIVEVNNNVHNSNVRLATKIDKVNEDFAYMAKQQTSNVRDLCISMSKIENDMCKLQKMMGCSITAIIVMFALIIGNILFC